MSKRRITLISKKGDWVLGYDGWQNYAVSDGAGLVKPGDNPAHPSWAWQAAARSAATPLRRSGLTCASITAWKTLLNTSARVPVCGLVSGYSATDLPAGPDRLPLLMGTLLKKRIRMQGFVIGQDYGHRIAEFQKAMGQWLREGTIKYREQITDGLEHAPEAFFGLLKGENFGKVVIRVSADD